MGRKRDTSSTETEIRVDRYNRPVCRVSVTGSSAVRGKSRGAYTAAAESCSNGTRIRNISVEGKWSLTDEHDLRFRASGAVPEGISRSVLFRTDIIKADKNSISFRLRKSDAGTRTISLNGKWRADRNNRLVFDVSSSSGKAGSLRFQGAWRAGDRNELIYKYKKPNVRGRKDEHEIIFKGGWELGQRKISYSVGGSTASVFNFSARLANDTLKAAEGGIRYVVGVRFKSHNVWHERRRLVIIHGSWKVKDGLKVSFEAFGGDTSRAVVFHVEKTLRKKNRMMLELRAYRNKGPNIRLELNRDITRDAKLFLALERSAEEYSVMGGLTLKF